TCGRLTRPSILPVVGASQPRQVCPRSLSMLRCRSFSHCAIPHARSRNTGDRAPLVRYAGEVACARSRRRSRSAIKMVACTEVTAMSPTPSNHTSWGLETEILIVWGAQDPSHNPAGAEIRHCSPQTVFMPLVGHMPGLEQPEGC